MIPSAGCFLRKRTAKPWFLRFSSVFAMVMHFNFAREIVSWYTGRSYDTAFKARLVEHIVRIFTEGDGGLRGGSRIAMIRLRLLAVAVALAALFSGCVNLGPNYQKPEPGFSVPERFQHQPDAAIKAPRITEDRWWTVFGDPEIDRIVEEALANNLDIRTAAARIVELRAQFIRSRADRLPSVGLESAKVRQRERNIEIDIYSLSFPASFEIDLWSRLAKAEDAARYDPPAGRGEPPYDDPKRCG